MAVILTRQQKKTEKETKQLRLFLDWMSDLRGYLLEADHENIDRRIIIKQFKRKLKRMPKGWYTVTRLAGYVRFATSRED